MSGFRFSCGAAALVAAIAPVHAAERGFTITDFDRIRLEGPYTVEVSTGRSTSARATGERRAIERVSLQVQGRTLFIRPDRNVWGGYPGENNAGPVIIRISTGALRSISLSGSGSMAVDRVRGPRIDLIVQGSGRLDLARVETDRLDIALAGSGVLRVAGSVKALSAATGGAASLDGAQLMANDLILKTESAGDVTLAARTSAKVQSTGSGRTTVTGSAACTVTAIGSGPVACGRGVRP